MDKTTAHRRRIDLLEANGLPDRVTDQSLAMLYENRLLGIYSRAVWAKKYQGFTMAEALEAYEQHRAKG